MMESLTQKELEDATLISVENISIELMPCECCNYLYFQEQGTGKWFQLDLCPGELFKLYDALTPTLKTPTARHQNYPNHFK